MSITYPQDIARPTATNARPLDLALSTWRDAKPSGAHGWYSARCTGHNDRQASLSLREAEDGGIILHCHAGCSREAIIAGAGLAEKALHVRGKYRPVYQPRPKYDIHQLAHAKLLPWQFLFNEGVQDDYRWHNSDVVQIRYYDQCGDEYPKVRVRTGPSGNKDSFWDEDTPGQLIPYGYQWLPLAREKGYLLLGEGESDGWTCRYHDVPYLGVPGANNTQCLDGSLLNDIPAIYVIQEPDAAGQGFYKKVHRRLRETGYTGQMFALPWQKLTGWKDPNELHRMIRLKDPNDTHAGFQHAVAIARNNAIPAGDDIGLSVSEMNREDWVPRTEYEEMREQCRQIKEQRDFILRVIAVPKEKMTASDKIVNIVLDDELRRRQQNEKGFAPISLRELTPRVGLGYKTVCDSKNYLLQKMHLYEQETVSFFHTKPDGETTTTSSIFLKPTPRQAFPRLYESDEPIEWGGAREKKKAEPAAPVCPNCGSENVDQVETTICYCCHQVNHQETYSSPVFFAAAATQGQEAPPAEYDESPLEDLTILEEEEEVMAKDSDADSDQQVQEETVQDAIQEDSEGIGQVDPLITLLEDGQVDLSPREEPEIPERETFPHEADYRRFQEKLLQDAGPLMLAWNDTEALPRSRFAQRLLEYLKSGSRYKCAYALALMRRELADAS